MGGLPLRRQSHPELLTNRKETAMHHATLDVAFRALAPAMPAHHPKSFHVLGFSHHVTGTQGTWLLAIVVFLFAGGFLWRLLRGSSS